MVHAIGDIALTFIHIQEDHHTYKHTAMQDIKQLGHSAPQYNTPLSYIDEYDDLLAPCTAVLLGPKYYYYPTTYRPNDRPVT